MCCHWRLGTPHLQLGTRANPTLSPYLEGTLCPKNSPQSVSSLKIDSSPPSAPNTSNGELNPSFWLLTLSFSSLCQDFLLSPSPHLAAQLHFLPSTPSVHPDAP